MDAHGETLSKMDFEFFANGRHIMSLEEFFNQKCIVLLDVRSREETDMVHFKLKYHCPVINIPINELPKRHSEIPKDTPVAIFCSGTQRASIAFGYLRGLGYDNVKILGGTIEALSSYLKPGLIKNMVVNK